MKRFDYLCEKHALGIATVHDMRHMNGITRMNRRNFMPKRSALSKRIIKHHAYLHALIAEFEKLTQE